MTTTDTSDTRTNFTTTVCAAASALALAARFDEALALIDATRADTDDGRLALALAAADATAGATRWSAGSPPRQGSTSCAGWPR